MTPISVPALPPVQGGSGLSVGWWSYACWQSTGSAIAGKLSQAVLRLPSDPVWGWPLHEAFAHVVYPRKADSNQVHSTAVNERPLIFLCQSSLLLSQTHCGSDSDSIHVVRSVACMSVECTAVLPMLHLRHL